ncbi:DUF397 domain-containing protein [Streptomyces sp. Li-HN-5-11]|uniref:DUF397 domain-containing protein n=1 Tax=Streptomyces sp. Li-HN-5-11 TaxID=3075432 RepID=UPI0028B15C7A|nr:DUF397 domain-containing protein [Streptomyces sp. Li-HN-5-11]WNM35344.1 DUF397 domain-containing protein [Streptomyces sp. Li-HN-5-11]
MAASSELHWIKSSYSGGSGTECVECAQEGSGALVRDSKHEGGPVIAVRIQSWASFVAALRKAELRDR